MRRFRLANKALHFTSLTVPKVSADFNRLTKVHISIIYVPPGHPYKVTLSFRYINQSRSTDYEAIL